MGRVGWSLCALVAVLTGVQSCVSARSSSTRSTAGNKCADHTDGGWFKKGLEGDVRSDIPRARRIARQIDGVISQGKVHGESGGKTVTLLPTCKARKLSEKDLKKGRFIGVLTGEGTSPRFSDRPGDIVYWWVFGEDSILPGGEDTVVHRSRFLSLNSTSTDPVKDAPFIVCRDRNAEELPVDTVDWHGDSCGSALNPLTSHNPWFGCKLGCCYSAMPGN